MSGQTGDPAYRLALAVREACIEAAKQAYEDAGISGLCAEGRWEVALGAIGQIDLDQLIRGAEVDDAAG